MDPPHSCRSVIGRIRYIIVLTFRPRQLDRRFHIGGSFFSGADKSLGLDSDCRRVSRHRQPQCRSLLRITAARHLPLEAAPVSVDHHINTVHTGNLVLVSCSKVGAVVLPRQLGLRHRLGDLSIHHPTACQSDDLPGIGIQLPIDPHISCPGRMDLVPSLIKNAYLAGLISHVPAGNRRLFLLAGRQTHRQQPRQQHQHDLLHFAPPYSLGHTSPGSFKFLQIADVRCPGLCGTPS